MNINNTIIEFIKKVNQYSSAKISLFTQYEIGNYDCPAQYNWKTNKIEISVDTLGDYFKFKCVVIHELRHIQQRLLINDYNNGKTVKDVNNDIDNWIENAKVENYVSDTNSIDYYTQPLEFDAYAFTEMIFILDNEQQYNRQFVQPEFIDYKKSLINLAKKMIQTYKTIK